MRGPQVAPSLADIPLSELLPEPYTTVLVELRRAGARLDSGRPATEPSRWFWYPANALPPSAPRPGISELLVGTGITLYSTGVDWLELTLDIAWAEPPRLAVSAAVEVACWCPQDHNMHQVRDLRWEVATGAELVDALDAAATTLLTWLRDGPYLPGPWRTRAGMDNAPL